MRRRWRWAAEAFEELLAAGRSPESAERTILNDLCDGRLSSRSVRQTGRLGFDGFVYSRPVDPQHERDGQAFWITVRDDQRLDGYRVKLDFAKNTVSAGPQQRALLQIRDNQPIIAATLAATEAADSAAAEGLTESVVGGAATDSPVKPPLPTRNELQAVYDARLGDHVPTVEDDAAWAKTMNISRKRVRELRRTSSDERLHKLGRRITPWH
jgi:hypothetical protein